VKGQGRNETKYGLKRHRGNFESHVLKRYSHRQPCWWRHASWWFIYFSGFQTFL